MSPFDRICPWLATPLAQLEEAAAGNRLGHGWLISGPRGTGKTNLAYVFLDRLLAPRAPGHRPQQAGPRELVAAYERHARGFDLHPDLHRVWANDERFKKDKDKEKRSISVEQIRATTADLVLKPHAAGVKAVVVERAETMTTEAANALLKTLEEPTPDTYLLLLADRPGRLPATIRSRCQALPLTAPAADRTRTWLADDGLDPASLPAQALFKPPLTLAQLLCDVELSSNYRELFAQVEALFNGRGDPHELANSWQGGDTELALTCLIENLQARIRSRLAGGHSNPVTDTGAALADNPSRKRSTRALLAGLQAAESLREQLGRGTNVELALKSLLLGFDAPVERGVNA